MIDLEFRHGALNHAPEAQNSTKMFYFRQRLWGRDAASNDRMKLIALERRVRDCGLPVRDYHDASSLRELIVQDILEIMTRDF